MGVFGFCFFFVAVVLFLFLKILNINTFSRCDSFLIRLVKN